MFPLWCKYKLSDLIHKNIGNKYLVRCVRYLQLISMPSCHLCFKFFAAGGDPANELVRHFLIEPNTRGVRLKGCVNEPIFGSLSALIYQHTLTQLALPCKLALPDIGKLLSQNLVVFFLSEAWVKLRRQIGLNSVTVLGMSLHRGSYLHS